MPIMRFCDIANIFTMRQMMSEVVLRHNLDDGTSRIIGCINRGYDVHKMKIENQ